MGKVWLLDLKKMSIFTGIVRIIFTPEIINYRNRKGAVQKYICESEKVFRIDIFYTNRL